MATTAVLDRAGTSQTGEPVALEEGDEEPRADSRAVSILAQAGSLQLKSFTA